MRITRSKNNALFIKILVTTYFEGLGENISLAVNLTGLCPAYGSGKGAGTIGRGIDTTCPTKLQLIIGCS